jgi:hypothetical protein
MLSKVTFIASLAALEATLKVDLIQAVGKPVLTAVENVEANPTVANILGQKIVVAGALVGAVPQLESEGISAIAGWLAGEIQTAIPAVTTPATPPSA